MGNVRVSYTITVKAVDGKELSFDKEWFLPEQNDLNAENLQNVVEREFRETEQIAFVTALQHELGQEIADMTFKVTKVTELKSAGDDDQM